MPCRDYEDSASSVNNNLHYTIDDLEREVEKYKDRCNKLSALLCLAGAELYQQDEGKGHLAPVYTWYVEHRKADVENLGSLIENLDIESLTKQQFDALDSLLLTFGEKT